MKFFCFFFIIGKHYSMFENVTAACGICSTTKICGGSNGAEASSILVRHIG